MNPETTFDRLTKVFRAVFRDEELKLGVNTSPGDIETWDSLNHVVLISAIEEEFSIKFKLRELMSMDDVGDILRLIGEKTGKAVS